MVDPSSPARLLETMVPTEVHVDFSIPVAVQTETLAWHPSPAPGVERRILDRLGGEVARATSIVRYAPRSRFEAHQHGAGEEFLVLDGVFSDEFGDYPKGTYVRNPWGTQHTPSTESGCTLFVKLRQMDPTDQRRVVVDADGALDIMGPGSGIARKFLHAFGSEVVTLESWSDGASEARVATKGAELLLLSGTLLEGDDARHEAGTWLRRPPGAALPLTAVGHARFWFKRGHLDPPLGLGVQG